MQAQRLRQIRNRNALTQTQLGAAAGMAASAVSGIERGFVRPSAARAHAIAEALGVAVEDVEELREAVRYHARRGRDDG
ncbi:helix-turn-helix domain-containing protein [Candidatus Poribacteria bacterium]|jgi:transcriptional regulator with XRE-family HTH domain|nr:helix-turn-helix domain-containing protein [Candidatus Poribacteria bacterium]MBT5533091.1 helix-turn-helix domain-containing protein [Candidatus Poribacteria bacterium]MBT5711722.1 helix-turn-helix domain-containing protein [Candidatus Poribacteria bacterium]MBT7099132.1 helix-turn-helix domain-containing protein [Candidatus Poribacteria bacterium]MBT7808185.1 helix-turn-helix domain-containing protein [Candidatus Poribacteria bacterium]